MSQAHANADPAPARPDFMIALGLLPPYTVEDVKRAYFDRALAAHPDRGGSAADFIKLHDAYTKATEYAGFRASRMHWLGAWVEHYAAQELVAAEIRRLGGEVELENAGSVSQSIGDDFATVFERVVGVRFEGPAIGDPAVHYLVAQHATLAGLRALSLTDCRVSSDAVAALQVFGDLRRVDLSGTPIGYSAVKPLLQLRELQSLNLERTRISWWRRLLLEWHLGRLKRAREKATPRIPGL